MHRFSRVLRPLAVFFLIVMLLAQSLPALAVGGSTSMANKGDRYIVNVEGLNFRAGPGMGYRIITSLEKGTVLVYLSNSDGWWKMYTASGKVGYVDRQYLTQDTTEKQGNYFVTASSLRIRKAPKTSAGVLGTVKKGTIVTISGLNGDWGYLSDGAGVQGWVALKYLSHYNNSLTSSAKTSSVNKMYEVAASALNVRASGSTHARRLDTLRNGKDVYVLKVDGDWGRIAYKSSGKVKYGWVKLEYLSAK